MQFSCLNTMICTILQVHLKDFGSYFKSHANLCLDVLVKDTKN